jgi:AraC-like DNA-binding protein
MSAKHFPGKDKKEYRDDHFADQVIRDSLEDWLEGQGKVFQQMIDGGVWSIMLSHTGFPAVDSRTINGLFMPTTLSDRILTKLLKQDMHFDGVVVTDGIGMGVLKTAYPNKEDLYVALLNAGNDILLNVKDFDYIDMIERAVNDGRVSMERIDDAAHKDRSYSEKQYLFLKLLLALKQPPVINHTAQLISQYIENNLVTISSLSDLCDKFHYSKNYIIRIFNKELGVSPIQYINHEKIKRAMYLLETTSKPIGEIAIECGYSDYPYFYKKFVQSARMSPLEWRKKIQENPLHL